MLCPTIQLEGTLVEAVNENKKQVKTTKIITAAPLK